ncbi:hypothetical protein TNCV_3816881 [Trichonephila clavipes]|nr:hypothetical protein TNCV_3816881 [Trichonephila clavipes]
MYDRTQKVYKLQGEHAAYSKICPKWQQEKEIQRIKVLENISYSEAKKRVVNILPPRASTSYANAEAAKILKPSIRIESGGIQATKEDVKLLSKRKIETKLFANKIRLEKPKGSP